MILFAVNNEKITKEKYVIYENRNFSIARIRKSASNAAKNLQNIVNNPNVCKKKTNLFACFLACCFY